MIMPDKNIRLGNSLLGMGAHILSQLQASETVSSLWEKVKTNTAINSYEKFVLTLDFLFMLNLIDLQKGIIVKVHS